MWLDHLLSKEIQFGFFLSRFTHTFIFIYWAYTSGISGGWFNFNLKVGLVTVDLERPAAAGRSVVRKNQSAGISLKTNKKVGPIASA